MASKWKYASVPAEERVTRIRQGDKDLYDSEIDRSLDVIASRKELGLDIGEQKDWIDRLSYNYNLSNAEKQGIDPADVSKTGYAAKLLGENTSAKKGYGVHYVKNLEAWDKAYDYLKEYDEKVKALSDGKKVLDEYLINNGIDRTSGSAKRYYDELDKQIADKAEQYRKEYISKVKALGFREA